MIALSFHYFYDFSCLFENVTNLKYVLQAIVVHSGEADHGHYFSFIRGNNVWYRCNNSDISKVSMGEVRSVSFGLLNTSATMLFFRKENYV